MHVWNCTKKHKRSMESEDLGLLVHFKNLLRSEKEKCFVIIFY